MTQPDGSRPAVVPHGEWPSPVTAASVVAAASTPSEVRTSGAEVWWSESRPEEGGRIQLVRLRPDGDRVDVLPEGWSARTRVHEYGGAAWLPQGSTVYFARWDDQRLYRLDAELSPADPRPITPEPDSPHALRYADLAVWGDWLLCVRERHEDDGEVINELVAVPSDGGGPTDGEPVVLVGGADFVSDPRPSPDGTSLAWISWDHPDMPWDATQLSVATIELVDGVPSLGPATVVAGGPRESVSQPRWRSDGTLHLITDRTGWWNIWSVPDGGAPVAVTALDAEVGTPQWVFGMSRYCFLDSGPAAGSSIAAVTEAGQDRLVLVRPGEHPIDLDLPYTELASLAPIPGGAALVAAGPRNEPVVVDVRVEVDPSGLPTAEVRELSDARALPVGADWFSIPQSVSFPSAGGRMAHALHYPPTNPMVTAPEGTAPPLLVQIHGGPTAMARGRLSLATTYWTSRGFAVVDVNYGGSTGFGRQYRDLLRGSWGIVDVEDCIAAAQHLASSGLADPARLCIEGGSAGGFTVLAALVASDVFAAGASSYGVADLRALAAETHKFESRYLDGLIGRYPEDEAVYDERSPINHADRITAPLIVFQGLEDEIVPPNQSEMIVESLRTNDVPVAYLAFEGEQHGFRRAETVIAVLESKLDFLGQVLGFTPADEVPRVDVFGLRSSQGRP